MTHINRHFFIIVLLLFSIFVAGCSNNKIAIEEKLGENRPEEATDVVEEDEHLQQEQTEIVTNEITVTAVGDILIHDRVYDDAKVESGYDFRPMLAQVKDHLQQATITFANQETMIGGEEIGLSGYPRFNSPTEVGDALKDAGVDIVSLANNHTLDHGEVAIQRAIEYWEQIDMEYVGAYKNEEDRDEIRVIETEENISVAFLAYSYGTNGIPVPEGKDYLVNLIEKETIQKEMERAKEVADVMMISLHFGNEYERYPSEEQKDLVQFVADEGAHVVLGHHPHVLQPIEWVEGKEGNKTLVAYSLGNFLSGQVGIERQIGGAFTFTIEKTTVDGEEMIDIHSPEFLPTYNASENEQNYRVIPMHSLLEEDLPHHEEHYKEIKEHLSQWLPELEFKEK